jgi:hypothetical protein
MCCISIAGEVQPPLEHDDMRLLWTMPVNIAGLGARLEAYTIIWILHLCHANRTESTLTRFPQEMIDQSVGYMVHVLTKVSQVRWD